MTRKLLAACAAALLSAGWGAGPASAQNEIKIGVVAALSGGFAAGGKDMVEGIKAWAKLRNAEGGLNGKKIVLEILDDETNPVNSVNAYRRLASDPNIVSVFLAMGSQTALAIKSIASDQKVPAIGGGAVDTLGIPADPYFFKVAPAARDFMVAMVNYAKKRGWKRIASLNGSDAYGQTEIRYLQELAKTEGLEIVSAETFGVEDMNFNAQLTKVRLSKPDVVYIGATGRTAILLYRQFKQLGIETPVIMSQAAISQSFFKGIGGTKSANGILFPTQLGSFGTAIGGESAKLFVSLQKVLGYRPRFLNTYGFDVGLIFEGGYRHSDGSRQGIRDALEKLKDLPAINGPVTYTPSNHTGQNFRAIRMGRLENGNVSMAK
jgi:branched-chain amino acid transport system substrate-binding protein